MKGPEKTLTVDEQETVGSVLRSFVTPSPSQVPGLVIHAAAIERTHVHLLTGAVSVNIHELVGRMKGVSSSAVAGFTFLDDPDPTQLRRTWTRGFWKVFLFDDAGVRAVQKYVQAHNSRRGFSPSRFLWEQPASNE